jgi:hypothetical protein
MIQCFSILAMAFCWPLHASTYTFLDTQTAIGETFSGSFDWNDSGDNTFTNINLLYDLTSPGLRGSGAILFNDLQMLTPNHSNDLFDPGSQSALHGGFLLGLTIVFLNDGSTAFIFGQLYTTSFFFQFPAPLEVNGELYYVYDSFQVASCGCFYNPNVPIDNLPITNLPLPASTPEPGSLSMALIGGVGLAGAFQWLKRIGNA